jgi:predicted phosphoadenosine phosphosulfate sulfurtransferase
MDEAKKRNQTIGVLFADLEGQYKLTIDHIKECFDMYRDNIEPFWVCLPLHLRNAVSQFQTHWVCWDKNVKEYWVRDLPSDCISDEEYFPFYKYSMEFEEFVPAFGHWYGKGEPTICFVGIRTEESLNRWRTLTSNTKQCIDNKKWTTWLGNSLYNAYPIYDWKTKDDWSYIGKYKLCYNRLYDRMYQAGLTIHQMRICQPYGDDQRKGLWLFQVIEPETWAKIVSRVNGANQGSLYAKENGNILGIHNVVLPNGHTWKSFVMMILDTMPPKTANHFSNKIAVFLKWYQDRGYRDGIPDDGPMDKTVPSWKRICKTLLRNDYWCKGLSFTQHKSEAYKKYLKLMKKRRDQWGLI